MLKFIVDELLVEVININVLLAFFLYLSVSRECML